MTGKSSRRGTVGGVMGRFISSFFMLAACLSGINMGFLSLGQAYVGILSGPEIGDLWVGR